MSPIVQTCRPADNAALTELAESAARDSLIDVFAESAQHYHPRGAVALLLVDQVVTRVAQPVMRALVADSILRKIRHVADRIDGPDWRQCPAFHAYVTLADLERRMGNHAGSEAWLARLAELDGSADGAR